MKTKRGTKAPGSRRRDAGPGDSCVDFGEDVWTWTESQCGRDRDTGSETQQLITSAAANGGWKKLTLIIAGYEGGTIGLAGISC